MNFVYIVMYNRKNSQIQVKGVYSTKELADKEVSETALHALNMLRKILTGTIK